MRYEYRKVNNDTVVITSIEKGQTASKLFPAVYTVGFKEDAGYFLKQVSQGVTLPEKVYTTPANDILLKDMIKTYDTIPTSMGIIAVGYKGGGKSLLSQQISSLFLGRNLPTVYVEQQFTGSPFSSFIDSLGECVLVFDEFVKVYNDPRKMEALLPMFDGRSKVKRLTMVIDNNVNGFSSYMIGRPNRFRYLLSYGTLDPQIINEYVKDHLPKLSKAKTKEIMKSLISIPTLNFDTMAAIIDESKLFPTRKIEDLLSRLNIDIKDNVKAISPKLAVLKGDGVKSILGITVGTGFIEVEMLDTNGRVNKSNLEDITYKDGEVSGTIPSDRLPYEAVNSTKKSNKVQVTFPFERDNSLVYTWLDKNRNRHRINHMLY